MDVVERFGIYWTNLDPTIGSEIKKTRPAVVISPSEIHDNMNTAIIAPLTSTLKAYPFRYKTNVKGKDGEIALDQLRCVDKNRIGKRLSELSEQESKEVRELLIEIFI